MNHHPENQCLKSTDQAHLEPPQSCEGVGVILAGNNDVNKGNCRFYDGQGQVSTKARMPGLTPHPSDQLVDRMKTGHPGVVVSPFQSGAGDALQRLKNLGREYK